MARRKHRRTTFFLTPFIARDYASAQFAVALDALL